MAGAFDSGVTEARVEPTVSIGVSILASLSAVLHPTQSGTPRMPPDSNDPDSSSLLRDGVPDGPALATDGAFVRRILATRRAKDDFFAHSHHSPLPRDRRRDFAGLAYFEPDPSYRHVGLRLEPVGDGETAPFAIDTSDGRPRMAHRLGRLRFIMAGLDRSLTAYRVEGGESDALFVPFRDETSGRETYGAGRYLDLEPEADGTYVLDFNLAYHPYCAYSDSYSCPLPPAENRLPLPIEAGERLGVMFRSNTEG